MILGLALKPGHEYTCTSEEEVHLSLAALESRGSNSDKVGSYSQLLLRTDTSEQLLCTLVHGTIFQQCLNLKLMAGEKVTFMVEGSCGVYVTGYSYSSPLEQASGESATGQEDTTGDDSAMYNGDVNVKSDPGESDTFNRGSCRLSLHSINCGPAEGSHQGGSRSTVERKCDQAACEETEESFVQHRRTDNTNQSNDTLIDYFIHNNETDSEPGDKSAVQMETRNFRQQTGENAPLTCNGMQIVIDPDRTDMEAPGTLDINMTTKSCMQQNMENSLLSNNMIVGSIDYDCNGREPTHMLSVNMKKGKTERKNFVSANSVKEVANDDIGRPNRSDTDSALTSELVLLESNYGNFGKCFKCGHCEKTFHKRSNFIRHERIHTGEKPFKCKNCEKVFSQKVHLKTHATIHSGEKPFNCMFCEEKFRTRFHLIRHEKIHTGEKPYKCKHCGKDFRQKVHLTMHERIHSVEMSFPGRNYNGEQPFKCSKCKKKFNRKSNLLQHEKIHIGENFFNCNYCTKTFNTKWALIQHKRIHTGERPFKCKICEKEFNQKIHLTTHERIHGGDKPFKCKYCGKAFNQTSHLVSHGRLHTGAN